jgi:hypothetical protein
MPTQNEKELGQKILEKLIEEVESAIRHHERTLEGLKQRLVEQLQRRDWLLLKKAEFAVDNREDDRSIADWVFKLLLERGEPMHVRDIVRELEANGIRSRGENGLMNTVMSALSRRNDLFTRIARGLYALTDEDSGQRRVNRKNRRSHKLELVNT